MNPEIRTDRNRRNYHDRSLNARYSVDSHGRKHYEKNPSALSEYLENHPLVKELIDQSVNARMNFIEQTAQGKDVDNPMYLWTNPYVDEQGNAHGMGVSVVPSSSIKEGDQAYNSVRDLLDMIYWNTAFDDDGNERGFILDDLYDYASTLMRDKIFGTKKTPIAEADRRPILEDYWRSQNYNPVPGTEGDNWLEQSQEWQSPTGLASALSWVAPRETRMKLDPEMQTMLDAGNEGKEWGAAGGDIGELALSFATKPMRFARLLARSPEFFKAMKFISPSLLGKVTGYSPKISKMFNTAMKPVNKTGDAIMNLGVSHPTVAAALGNGLDNAAIYGLARGYDELTDTENYYSSSPANAGDALLSFGIGAGVPLAAFGASNFLKLGGPWRDVAENLELAGKSMDERMRTALARSVQRFDENTAKIRPSDIPDQWVRDLGTPSSPTASWNKWLNADMNRFVQAHPDVHYSMQSNPPSNIEKKIDTSDNLGKTKMFGSGASEVKRKADPTTGRIGKETVLYDASGHKTVASREEGDTFDKPTTYSIEDWRSKLTPAQRRRMDSVDPNLSKNFSTANSVMDDPYQIMMQLPGRTSNIIVETPKQYSINQSNLRESTAGKPVADYRSKMVFASDNSGVPLPLTAQKEFKRARNDRANREKAAAGYIKGDNRASTPLTDLEKELKVPMPADVIVRGTNMIARTVGRNAHQSADKNEYKDTEK